MLTLYLVYNVVMNIDIKKLKKPILNIVIILVIAIVILFVISKIFKVDFLNEVRSTFSSFVKTDPDTDPAKQDSTPLDVEIKAGKYETFQPRISLTVTSNKEIKVENEEKFKLTFVKNEDGTNYYALEIVNIGVGKATIPVIFKDDSEQTKTVSADVTRTEFSLPLGLKDIKDWEGSTYTVDGDNLLVAVDKGTKLVSDYEPTDLVKLFDDKNLLVQTQDLMLRSEAADALSLMVQKLMADTGKPLTIASGYRSYNNQFRQYSSWVRQLGQEEADKVSARPGFSEHQLGTAIDFMSGDSGYDFVNEFDTTVAGVWLQANAYKYGFVQSYPAGEEVTTGYSYEAWHYRYIGIENGKEIKESGLTLKEFIEKKASN